MGFWTVSPIVYGLSSVCQGLFCYVRYESFSQMYEIYVTLANIQSDRQDLNVSNFHPSLHCLDLKVMLLIRDDMHL